MIIYNSFMKTLSLKTEKSKCNKGAVKKIQNNNASIKFSLITAIKKYISKSYLAVRASTISFWSVPAIVFRRFPRGLRVRVLRRMVVSWSLSVVAKVVSGRKRERRCEHIRSNLRPVISTATISAGNLKKITILT